MLDFVTGLQILLIVLVAMTFFAGVWIIGECFDSWGDFIKSLTDKEYNYLSFVFRKGKHIRFITDFPTDLRKECLGKESYYADEEDDSESARKAKMLVRRVLGNDAIVNEYFKGQYFTYKDFLEVKELCDLPEYDACTTIFTAALLTIAKTWKNLYIQNRGLAKEDVAHIYNGILPSH